MLVVSSDAVAVARFHVDAVIGELKDHTRAVARRIGRDGVPAGYVLGLALDLEPDFAVGAIGEGENVEMRFAAQDADLLRRRRWAHRGIAAIEDAAGLGTLRLLTGVIARDDLVTISDRRYLASAARGRLPHTHDRAREDLLLNSRAIAPGPWRGRRPSGLG